MKYPDNIREVAKLSPDYMGFIFYSKSKRFVGDDFVMPEISSGIKKVGVFVNERVEVILDKVRKYGLDFVQLHGDEPPAFCKELRARVKIIKAFGLPSGTEQSKDSFSFDVLNEYADFCDYFLFDTRTAEYGGSGQKFDRNLLQKYKLSKPFFISGGIDLGESAGLRSQDSRLFALDVNSKFETEPGLKDIYKLTLLRNELSGK